MRALIDGDILVYRIGFGGQHVIYKKDFLFSRKKLEGKGVVKRFSYLSQRQIEHNVDLTIDNIMSNAGADTFSLYLTSNDKSNFRFSLATIQPYKDNRKDQSKPYYYDFIREYLTTVYAAEVIYNQEADDALGIAQDPPNTTICTTDKDLDMVPGMHYNIVKQTKYTITDKEGIKNFYKQLLQGDATDNIPGIKGIGPVKAEKALEGLEEEFEMYQRVVLLYRERLSMTLPEAKERILEVGRLLWIRREEEQTWQPPEEQTSNGRK